MRIISSLLWLCCIVLTGLAAYAYEHKGLKLYLLIFAAMACLLSMSLFSLLTAPVRYKVGSEYFRHHPAMTLVISLFGIMLPYAIVMLAIEFEAGSGKLDPQLAIFWCITGTACNIYGAVMASKAMKAL